MAGDWIKMRGALIDHPKVIAMSRSLHGNREFRDWLTPGGSGPANGQLVSGHALRLVTTALLMRCWSVAREHGRFVENDLVLAHSTIEDMDEMAGAPGVGDAMQSVGWAREGADGMGLVLPNFIEFNVPMTNAEKQAEYRKRKNDVTEPLPTRGNKKPENVTTREEKSREEKKSKDQDLLSSASPKDENDGAGEKPADLAARRAERIAEVTDDAIAAFNRLLAKPDGRLASVKAAVGRKNRQSQIQRSWQTASEICQDQFGDKRVTPQFWEAYFGACADDPFHSGEGPYSGQHANWRPDFEFLTRPATMLKVFERATDEAESA